MTDNNLNKIYFEIMKLCNELSVMSKEFLNGIHKNGGNNECTMAFIFLNRQIEILESVMMLSNHKKSNAMSVLVRSMLENMAHLYYSNIKKGYADKWVAYQYVDILRTYEKKIKLDYLVTQDQIEDLIESLKEQCQQFVKQNYLDRVERSIQNKKLPDSFWYETSCDCSISKIIREVVKNINKVSKEQDREHYCKHLLEFLYHELSLRAHVKTQGFAYEYVIENNTMKLKENWNKINIDLLLMAIEYTVRVLHITNERFDGDLQDKLQEIASRINTLNNKYLGCIK